MARTKGPKRRRTKPPTKEKPKRRRTKPPVKEDVERNEEQTENGLLPDVLPAGMPVVSDTGKCIAFIVKTSGRDPKYDQRLYRLHYPKQMDGKWHMPAITSSRSFTRDQLHTMGLRVDPTREYRRKDDEQNDKAE